MPDRVNSIDDYKTKDFLNDKVIKVNSVRKMRFENAPLGKRAEERRLTTTFI